MMAHIHIFTQIIASDKAADIKGSLRGAGSGASAESWERPGLVSPAGVMGLHGLPSPLSRSGGWISDLSHCYEAIHVLSSAGIGFSLLRAPRLAWGRILSAEGPSWPKSLQSFKTSISREEIKSLEVSKKVKQPFSDDIGDPPAPYGLANLKKQCNHY